MCVGESIGFIVKKYWQILFLILLNIGIAGTLGGYGKVPAIPYQR